MSNLPEHNVLLYKGQNKILNISMLGVLGKEDLSGDSLTFSVYELGEETAIITKTTDDIAEIEIVASDILVKFLPADSSSLSTKRYYYNLWHTDSLGDIVPALTGFFKISLAVPNITNKIRNILDEAGELRLHQLKDQIFPLTTLNSLNVDRARIMDVQGVWKLSDVTHDLVNYYTGGTFEATSGKINLGTPLLSLLSDVRVDYIWESGISDKAIEDLLEDSKVWAEGYTQETFEYNMEDTNAGKALEALAISKTIIECIITINGANAAQLGYNFRLGDFEVQTKLWGEGMIAGEIFKLYKERLMMDQQVTGRAIYFKFPSKTYKQYPLQTLLNNSQGGT